MKRNPTYPINLCRRLFISVLGLLTAACMAGTLAMAQALPAANPATIADIRIEIAGVDQGRKHYAAMAEALIGLSPGDRLTQAAIAASTERLRLSRRFADIHVDATTRSDGDVLVFTLEPYRHARRINIQGNYPIFEQAIRNQMTLFAGDPFQDADLTEQATAIAKQFKRAGYMAPRVTVSAVDPAPDGTAVLLVEIEKGPALRPGSVHFTGNHAVSDAALKWRLSSWRSVLLFGSGRFSEYQLKQDLERLTADYHRKGFADAAIAYRIDNIAADGEVDVTITVDEGTRYRVVFDGNDHFWDLTLKKDVVIFENGNRGGRGVRRSIRNIKQRYRTAGFADIAVTVEKRALPDSAADATELRFHIEEGPRTIVQSVAVRGNQAISEAAVKDQVLTRPPGLLHDGAFDPDIFDEDLYAVTVLYMGDGFQARRVTPALAFNDERTAVAVTIDIEEGRRTVVRRIDIIGPGIVPETELRGALLHTIGGPFRRPALDAEKEAMASLVAEKGYPHAGVESSVTFDDDRTAADIVHKIIPGPRVVMGEIFVSGNLRTDESVIRRELTVQPGSPLALRTLHDGQRRLRDLDIFSNVDYRTFGLKEQEDTVNLFVDVRERRPFYVEASTGYESDSGVYGRIKTGDRNLFGVNKHLWGSAEISETGHHLETQVSDPRFLGTRTTASLAAFHEEMQEYNQPFGTRTTGGALNFDRALGDHLTGALSFTVEQRRLFDIDDQATAAVSDRARTVFVTTPFLRYDSRNSFVRPTEGIYSSISVDVSKGVNHQIDDFFRYQLDGRIYHSVTDGITLAAMARIGQVASYAGDSAVPDDQLFYLGGIQDVRGYSENLLRFDAQGDAVGGRTSMVGSLEARIDLGMNVELTTFFDMGSVKDAIVDSGDDSFRTSVGMGLRYITPIGPIGLMYGHKLDRRAGESSGRFHLSIGYSF